MLSSILHHQVLHHYTYAAPYYTIPEAAAKYHVAPTYYTEAAQPYYAEPVCYTEAPVYYTATYAATNSPLRHRSTTLYHLCCSKLLH
jgi:hypothetical protein